MKKIIALALAAVMALSMVACGGTKDEDKTNTDAPVLTYEQEVEALTKVIDDTLAEVEMPIELVKQPVDLADADAVAYFSGVADATQLKALVVAEPMIGSIPFSVVVAKVADGVATADVRQAMIDGIALNKWVCVQANVSYAADWEDGTVAFVMFDKDSLDMEAFKAAFEKIKGEAVTGEIFFAEEAEVEFEDMLVEGEVEGEAAFDPAEGDVEDDAAEEVVAE